MILTEDEQTCLNVMLTGTKRCKWSANLIVCELYPDYFDVHRCNAKTNRELRERFDTALKGLHMKLPFVRQQVKKNVDWRPYYIDKKSLYHLWDVATRPKNVEPLPQTPHDYVDLLEYAGMI